MKKCIYIISISCIFISMHTYAAENQLHITYHKAGADDAQKIVTIINTKAYQDSTRIVIVPKKFRVGSVVSAITDKKLYVAKNPNNEIVGFKKLFVINLEKDFDDITRNELRCLGSQRRFVDARIVSMSNPKPIVIAEELVRAASFHDSTLIYFGWDYTDPAYRNKKINSDLIRYAFNCIQGDVITSIRTKNVKNLVLLYGLTQANAGEGTGEIDRSPSIIRAFITFAERIARQCGSEHKDSVSHCRYRAFMPTFNPNSSTCVPLPDRHAIAGYGNVLLFPLVTQQSSAVTQPQ